MDQPLRELLRMLPLVDEIKDAISNRDGLMGEAIKCVEAYERCEWNKISCGNLDESEIREAYLSSVAWARAASQAVLV